MLKSGVPSDIDGTGGIFCSIPSFSARLITGFGPISFINLAVIVFRELANPDFKVSNPE